MTTLIKIGNSQGVRIPKTVIEQAGLAGQELEFAVMADGLLIKPLRKQPRQEWEQHIRKALQTHAEGTADTEWLDAPLTTDDDWEW
ncbi:MAG: AbrB/MazE/SpoVT family DNA-binding domain-containing protein [Chloroflexi bacterium]|nr:AbrB/MazE/SpoVT family DNA-binding domain-containing protein [Chloroflexota bacterium]